MMDDQLGCTEEETAALMKNSDEAAKAQGLEPLNDLSFAGHGMSVAAAASMLAAIATSLLMWVN